MVAGILFACPTSQDSITATIWGEGREEWRETGWSGAGRSGVQNAGRILNCSGGAQSNSFHHRKSFSGGNDNLPNDSSKSTG